MFKLFFFEVYPLLTLEYEIDGRLGGIGVGFEVGFEELKATRMIKLNSTVLLVGLALYIFSPNLEFS